MVEDSAQRKVILVDPADIAHDGKPTFKKGFPDERYDVIVMKVVHRPQYRGARKGDTLQYEGGCYEVVGSSEMLGADASQRIDGVIVFHVNHKGAIPC